MQVSLIDPGMVWSFGHNRQMNIVLAKEFQRRGYRPKIYCHQSYSPLPEEKEFGFEIVPLFSANPYLKGFGVEKGQNAVEVTCGMPGKFVKN